jgi:type IV secretory pathway TraG/TraD family ATPase VirD4
MNFLTSLIERMALGWSDDPAKEPVLRFPGGVRFTRRDSSESILVLASTGKGKTTLSRTIGRAYLRNGYGGLILAVKSSQIEDAKEMCRLEGRERDLIVIGPGTGHRFDPLEGVESSSEAAALLSEIAGVVTGGGKGHGENESFWSAQLGIILRNLFVLCRIFYGRHDLLRVAALFDGRARTLAELSDPSWIERSPMAAALTAARTVSADSDAHLAVSYFTQEFPTLGDRLQGSLAATVAGVFDYLRRIPLREMFCEEPTFSIEDVFRFGSVCVVGLAALDSVDGRISNAIMQYCFCRAAVRKKRERFTFLLSDECQETVTQELVRQLAVLRESRVSSVMMTQNLAILDDRIGETQREAFCGLLNLKIFGPQGHAATRQWEAEQIGKKKAKVETQTTSRNSDGARRSKSSGTSVNEHWDYRVPPSRFAELAVGETICLRDSRIWLSTWHREKPGKGGTVAIVTA